VHRPLYSERAGRARTLNTADFAKLLWRAVIVWARDRGLFAEAFEAHKPGPDPHDTLILAGPRVDDLDAFLLDRLHVSLGAVHLTHSEEPPYDIKVHGNEDLLFDLLELLHDECVSLPRSREGSGRSPIRVGPFNRREGQRLFRERLNPVLAKHSPPLVMRDNGHINELPAEGLEALVAEPIPETVEPELRDPVDAAADRFFRRGATHADKIAALRDLAGVLERLRPLIKEEMFSKDEAALFQIANSFAIRHHDRAQRGDYDEDVWLEWIFYVYLATAKAMIRIVERKPAGPPGD
jgi:hypothetical protein